MYSAKVNLAMKYLAFVTEYLDFLIIQTFLRRSQLSFEFVTLLVPPTLCLLLTISSLSSCSTTVWPYFFASCRGLLPSSLTSSEALCSSSSRTATSCPTHAAMHKGVAPSPRAASIAAGGFRDSSIFIAGTLFHAAASSSGVDPR